MKSNNIQLVFTARLLAATLLPLLPGCASHGSGLRTPDGRPMSQDYQKGRSDGVKTLYWNLQDNQRTRQPEERYGSYEVVVPEHWENGVLVQPSRRVLRIQE